MKNSFKIFSVILGLLVILIILRLNSVSYPGESGGSTELVYLEEFHGSGSLFGIVRQNNRFLLKPFIDNIKRKGLPIVKTVEIKDNDLITLENRNFLFKVFPQTTFYKEVFNRPLREIFPNLSKSKGKILGGWLITDRERIISRENNRALLERLLVEISAGELKKIIPPGTPFDNKLLELQISKNNPTGELLMQSFHIPVIMIRNRREQRIEKNTSFTVRDGDILNIPYQESHPGDGLFIKFNILRVRAVDYLSISYKKKIDLPGNGEQKREEEIAFLKSLDTGLTYNIDKSRQNIFIGGSGLFSFTLRPGQLLDKLYIPDKIPEGGIMDIKELLDRHMYYRQGNRFYPVTGEFLNQLKKIFNKKDTKEEITGYFVENKIAWLEFDDADEFGNFYKAAKALIKKMKNKGIFRTFTREIEKLNHRRRVMGVGIGVKGQYIENVLYKISGYSWMNAGRLWENTPIVSGIDAFYWGTVIKDTDEPAFFKIKFKQPPPSLRLIAAADYGYGFDGKHYTVKNFLDGVQTFGLPKGKKEIYLKVWNVKRFNRVMNSTNFQVEFILRKADGETVRLVSDHTWEASVNAVHWDPVRVNPSYSLPDPSAARLNSLWYDEQWNPVFSGIKSRYFRKKFPLDDIPQAVTWKIYASGDYVLRVNRKVVQREKDVKDALKKGNNVITVMLSRKGYRKHFYTDRMFKTLGSGIFLRQKQVHRASFRKARTRQKPVISDTNNTPLAYSSTINGKSQRFYSPGVLTELRPFFGSPAEGIWGLEQIFSNTFHEDKDKRNSAEISAVQLTLNREWQGIALDIMKKNLHGRREMEIANPEYLRLKKELAIARSRLQVKRSELSGSSTPAASQQPLMQAIIGLQNKIENINEQIGKIKNYFYEASAVLMGPKGEILTAASYPYDDETMKALNPGISKPYRPGENPYFIRGWKWNYNPGSTVKILDAAAFLYSKDLKDEKGKYLFPYLRKLLDPRSGFKNFPRSDLKGSLMLNGREIGFRLRNFQGIAMPEGFCSLKDALAHSYNTYFSYLALHNNRVLTVDSTVYNFKEGKRYKKSYISKANIPIARTYREYPILEFAEKLLMNREIDLLYNLEQITGVSKPLRMPNDSFMAMASRFPVNAYTPANVAHYSIGQGNFQLTALQNALNASTIFNGGMLYRPSIVKAVVLTDAEKREKQIIFDPERDKTRVFSASVANRIKEAMQEVVRRGSARELFRELEEGRQFYAKTGTAETELYKDNSLFVGFVGFKNGMPLIFSVIVPRSGLGAKVAGKLTEEILQAIIVHEEKKGRKL